MSFEEGFETITRTCPRCGAPVRVFKKRGFDKMTRMPKRTIKCTECSWSMDI